MVFYMKPFFRKSFSLYWTINFECIDLLSTVNENYVFFPGTLKYFLYSYFINFIYLVCCDDLTISI